MEQPGVTVIQPGRLVRIGPATIDAADVLELAEALIEEHGHAQGTGVSASGGMSIHHAIGEAAGRITQESAGKSGDAARPLKDAAAALFRAAHADPAIAAENTATGEVAINDRAGVGKYEAVEMLKTARADALQQRRGANVT